MCVELACGVVDSGRALSRAEFLRSCCASPRVYQTAFTLLQRTLGAVPRVELRELAVQYGCGKLEPAVRAALAAYRERFLAALPRAQWPAADFSRPAFLAVAFYHVARRQRVKARRMRSALPRRCSRLLLLLRSLSLAVASRSQLLAPRPPLFSTYPNPPPNPEP